MTDTTRNGHRYSELHVAIVCHDALVGLGRVHEMIRGPEDQAPGTAPFMHLHPDLQAAAVNGVLLARQGVNRPEDHHRLWSEFLESRGWRNGPRDPDNKTHPDVGRSWHDLDPLDRDKNRLYLSTVVTLTIG